MKQACHWLASPNIGENETIFCVVVSLAGTSSTSYEHAVLVWLVLSFSGLLASTLEPSSNLRCPMLLEVHETRKAQFFSTILA